MRHESARGGLGVRVPASLEHGINTAPGALESEGDKKHLPSSLEHRRWTEEGGSQAPHLPTPTWLFAATANRAEDGEWAGLEGRGSKCGQTTLTIPPPSYLVYIQANRTSFLGVHG